MTKETKDGWKAVIVLGILFIIVAGIASDPRDSSSSFGGNSASSNCRNAVKDQLRSPATAHFHGETVSSSAVVGRVDSENGFGALLTSAYVCDVDSNGTVIGSPTMLGN